MQVGKQGPSGPNHDDSATSKPRENFTVRFGWDKVHCITRLVATKIG
jgi:hypothetical protein